MSERIYCIKEIPPKTDFDAIDKIDTGFLVAESRGLSIGFERTDSENKVTYHQFFTDRSNNQLSRLTIAHTEKDFDELWPLVQKDMRLEKERLVKKDEGVNLSVVIYGGRLAGFATCSIEFDHSVAAKDFMRPDWLGSEITGVEFLLEEKLANDAVRFGDYQLEGRQITLSKLELPL